MKKLVNDMKLMVECCVLYFEEECNQSEIADRLKISRPTVSKLLKEAKERGIVHVIIENPLTDEYRRLERILEKKLNLQKVVIVDDRTDKEFSCREVAKAAARYLDTILRKGDIIGLSVGRIIDYIPEYAERDLMMQADIVPLFGGRGEYRNFPNLNQSIQKFAKAYNAVANTLDAPAYVRKQTQREYYFEKGKDIIDRVRKTDIALVELDSPLKEDSILQAGEYFTPQEQAHMNRMGAVGDICLQCYDIDGCERSFGFNKYIFGLKLKTFEKILQVIGLSCNIQDAEAIVGASRAGFIKTLFLTYSTAIAVAETWNKKS